MNAAESAAPAAGGERLLSPAAVAGRFLARISDVERWIAEGRLRSVQTPRGPRVPESALVEFQKQAYRRENFNGVDHGLHSWPDRAAGPQSLPVPVENAGEAFAEAPRWPFPRA